MRSASFQELCCDQRGRRARDRPDLPNAGQMVPASHTPEAARTNGTHASPRIASRRESRARRSIGDASTCPDRRVIICLPRPSSGKQAPREHKHLHQHLLIMTPEKSEESRHGRPFDVHHRARSASLLLVSPSSTRTSAPNVCVCLPDRVRLRLLAHHRC